MENEQTSEKILTQFDEIEKRVDKLISKIESLETENRNFKNKIAELEKENKEKEVAEKQYTAEKAKVRDKIDALLEKINHFTQMD